MTHFMIYMYNMEMVENYPEIICALSADLLEGLVEVVNAYPYGVDKNLNLGALWVATLLS
ncbi:hypothetical protein HXA31_03965 [Salipaludibacillus agaradhaerens]|jgi:hypothetical protein|uniref:Uncharacterized protein n=1 Tax=Salipaludibacillus agaradhaerens TaxID=76935 RepID=A0A9Q4FZ46_SALAG|nr:hypothetical protein [Salipaludibacillus agaradhaerens]MCR6097006.1 hypothetical protein [Salipaludibacillus agaradhaerens]MCR6113509.1 hypothetical protein [Salipaludibacillus agaradhaerens]